MKLLISSLLFYANLFQRKEKFSKSEKKLIQPPAEFC
jgi:hypothetical protein